MENPDGKFVERSHAVTYFATPWFPSRKERQACCDAIREPSEIHPLSLNKHCRSAEHIARLHKVDLKFLRWQFRSIRAARIDPPVQSPTRILWEQLTQQPQGEPPIRDSGYRYPISEEVILPPLTPQPGQLPFQSTTDNRDDSLSEVEALIGNTTQTKGQSQ